jgi:hypothetical protein
MTTNWLSGGRHPASEMAKEAPCYEIRFESGILAGTNQTFFTSTLLLGRSVDVDIPLLDIEDADACYELSISPIGVITIAHKDNAHVRRTIGRLNRRMTIEDIAFIVVLKAEHTPSRLGLLLALHPIALPVSSALALAFAVGLSMFSHAALIAHWEEQSLREARSRLQGERFDGVVLESRPDGAISLRGVLREEGGLIVARRVAGDLTALFRVRDNLVRVADIANIAASVLGISTDSIEYKGRGQFTAYVPVGQPGLTQKRASLREKLAQYDAKLEVIGFEAPPKPLRIGDVINEKIVGTVILADQGYVELEKSARLYRGDQLTRGYEVSGIYPDAIEVYSGTTRQRVPTDQKN